MDAALMGAYRLAWTDIVLINDAVKTCHSMNCLSVKNVAKALQLIVRHENDLIYTVTSGLQEDTEESGHVLDGNELSTESLPYVVWEFFHGVFLNFAVEELSQYPFWIAKTVSVVHPSPDYLAFALCGWMLKIRDMYVSDGFLSLFRGSAPYMINRGVESYQHLEKSVRHFLDSAGKKLERTAASIDVSKIKEPEQYASRRSSTRAAETSNKKKILKKENEISVKPSYLQRLSVAVMCHPLLLQAVRLVTDLELGHRNWVLLYFTMVSTGGITSLYKGLTSSIVFGVLPIPAAFYFGVVETVMYRRMAGQGSADRFGGGFSVLKSLLLEPSPSAGAADKTADAMLETDSRKPLGSLIKIFFCQSHLIYTFKYGLMTIGQVIPGFITFALSRIVMSNVLGETPQRHREISIRRKILRDYLLDRPKHSKAKKVSINSQQHAAIQSMHSKKRIEYSGREYDGRSGSMEGTARYERQPSGSIGRKAGDADRIVPMKQSGDDGSLSVFE